MDSEEWVFLTLEEKVLFSVVSVGSDKEENEEAELLESFEDLVKVCFKVDDASELRPSLSSLEIFLAKEERLRLTSSSAMSSPISSITTKSSMLKFSSCCSEDTISSTKSSCQ